MASEFDDELENDIECPTCGDSDFVECPHCLGDGTVFDENEIEGFCPECNGDCQIACPECSDYETISIYPPPNNEHV